MFQHVRPVSHRFLKHARLVPCVALVLVTSAAAWAADAPDGRGNGPVEWKRNGAPTVSMITGGPWTLQQSGAANGLKSAGYCDADGNQIGNPGTQRMSPYYFPVIYGRGKHLQGYFDWRPKDIDEAVTAASSDDAGYTWNFQDKVLELRTACPPATSKNTSDNSDNGDDDGQGHQYVIKINGHTYLYTLVRANNHIDVDDLIIHELAPQPGHPLAGVPALTDAPTDDTASQPEPAFHTHGLLNPDGILSAIPGTWPLKVIYEQKILNGDKTGATAFPPEQQCGAAWSDFYAQHGGLSPNDDITYLRLAQTTDGINFTDLGALQGLNDPTNVSAVGTRWVATAGTVLKLEGGRWGLLYSGGNCIDADSDSFHYIGYAESRDLIHWTVVNGINNPVVSTFPATLALDAQGAPATGSGSQTITIPSQASVAGDTQGWFAGRVYAPSAAANGPYDITVVFAGYHTQKPKNGLGDYRNIGRVSLHSSQRLLAVGSTIYDDQDQDEK